MHALKESQWIAAMVTCDNGAVAHTSPFYFIVDNQPTWNVRKAPGIIQKQLEALENTELEEKSRKIIDDGIIKRIANARAFYEGLTKGITSTKK